jgi:predicted flap endonuclease-1-like 5' DNA nuclease
MSTLTILLELTRSEATIKILSLLLVSAIIGYVTAWLFYKSIYQSKIKAIESERHEFNNHLVNLNAEIRNLNKSLREKDNETEHLTKEVKALKALHAEAVHETDDMTLKNIRTEQLLYEKDEALVNIAQRRHLLDYKSFGTATAAEKDDLKMISGIGPFIEERLHALDIYTFSQISKFTARDIETINNAIEYFSGRIERDEWVAQAKELAHSKEKRMEFLERIKARKTRIYYERIGIAHKNEADDLTIISGIGGWIQEKLNVLDIYTFRQISNFTEEDVHTVTEAIEYFPGRIERDEWILQAKELVRIAGKKSELHNRIKERKDRIYYDRLGVAHKHEANNLTLIKGIGLWIEERLNMLDIYTFEQISKLTPADVETITEILEISPGRIDKDNWVNQARVLAKKKLEQEMSHA